MDWMEKAACKDKESRLFSSYDQDMINQAKDICESCKVRKPCFDVVFESNCVTAGTTRYDRLSMMWGRVESIGQSNWNKSDKVFSGLFDRKK
jgi:hypothetical protein